MQSTIKELLHLFSLDEEQNYEMDCENKHILQKRIYGNHYFYIKKKLNDFVKYEITFKDIKRLLRSINYQSIRYTKK